MCGGCSVAARRKAPQRKRRSAADDRKSTGTFAPPLVLIVDDAEDCRDLYAEYLAYAGLRVRLAVDGDHGLWKVLFHQPDVIVMDLEMPVLDGWEATHQIKANRRRKQIPIIVLTGHADGDNVRRAEEAGADVVLTKPCAPEELLAVVERLLRR